MRPVVVEGFVQQEACKEYVTTKNTFYMYTYH